MILINFANKLNLIQKTQAEAYLHVSFDQIIDIQIEVDTDLSIAPQINHILDKIPLSPEEFEKEELVVNLPRQNYIAAMMLAGLHGRMGHFPQILRMYLDGYAFPPRSMVKDIYDLQQIEETNKKKDD